MVPAAGAGTQRKEIFMSATAVLIMIIAAFAISIIVGSKTKINIGLFSILFAFIIGCFFCGSNINTVISYFPVRFVFMIISVNFFFGFLIENGTMDLFAKKIMYLFRNATWFLPFAIGISSAIVCGVGGGSTVSTLVVGPIAYIIAAQVGFSPVLAVAAVVNFSVCTSMLPWTSFGVMLRGILGQTVDADIAYNAGFTITLSMFIIYLILFIIYYFVFKGNQSKHVQLEKPEDFNPVQKKSLILMLVTLGLCILGPVAKAITTTPFTTWLATYLDIQFLGIVFGVAAALMGLADSNSVIRNRIPWSLIILTGGAAMLVSVGTAAGTGQLMASWVTDNIAPRATHGVLTLIGALISFIADGVTVGVNTLSTALPGIAAVTGLSMPGLVNSLLIGVALTCISPFSTGGATILSLSGETLDENGKSKLFVSLIVLAAVQLVAGVLASFLGINYLF